jgi:hypothetical protein
MQRRPSALLALLSLGAALGGCGLFSKSEDQPVQEVKTKESPGKPGITVGELDQLARNYSDRLVARVSTACDQIKHDAREEEPRARAHQLKLSVALAAYDIVTSPGGSPQVPGAAQHVMDLAILTELHAIRWIDEHAARDQFGSFGGERLGEALSKAREDIWQLVARVMKPEQIDRLRTMILQWRQNNPDVEWLSRVRLDAIAQGKEGEGFTKSVGEGFNPLQPVVRAVDETRLLAAQAMFYLKRLPTILEWTTEATVAGALEVPKVATLVQGLTDTMGSVAGAVGTLERLMEPSSQEPAINSTIEEVKESLVQAKELVQEVRALQAAVEPLLNKPKKAETAGKKPVDINEVVSKVDDVTREATSLVRETRGLAESPTAMRNVDEVLGRTTRNISETGREVIDHATLRAVELVALIAVLVVVYKVVAFLIRKRRARAAKA